MLVEVLEMLLSIGLTALVSLLMFLLIWFATKHHKVANLKTDFANARKEAALAIAVVASNAFALAVLFFLLYQSAGGAIGTYNEYTLQNALLQWGLYGALFIFPVLAVVKVRRQPLETVGITRKNLAFSVALGFVLALVVLAFRTTFAGVSSKLFTSSTFYGFVYFSAVGFGEELLFRGFLQLRCTSWLGATKGLILASVVMAFIHLPQRIFGAGLDPLQAVISAIGLVPISLTLGFLMLRTQNMLGSAVLHTLVDWVNVL